MSNYYLHTGYSTMAMVGEIPEFSGTLPVPPDVEVANSRTFADPSGVDVTNITEALFSKLEPGDLLVVVHANTAASFIPSEWLEQYGVPEASKHEIFNSGGIVDSYEFFTDAMDEPWYRLVTADTDEDGSPLPLA